MNTALVALSGKLAERFEMGNSAADVVAVLKNTAFKGPATDAQLTALLIVANQYALNPFTKEIYAFPDKNNGIVPVVGVDGWSRIINSHAQFDGMDFEQDAESCTCIIFRKDRSHPVRVTEYMSECKRGTSPWQSHPKRMLRHKAMIQCARLAFGFVGIYEQDEAERIVDATFSEVPQGRIGKHSGTVAQPEDSEARDRLLASLQDVAEDGPDALAEQWQAIGPENRKMIGAAALESLKAHAAKAVESDAEVVE